MLTTRLSVKQIYVEIKLIQLLVDYLKFKRFYFLLRKNSQNNSKRNIEVLLVRAGGWSQSVTLPPSALEVISSTLCVVSLF